ncbi:glycosyltransferase family 2 protein [Actinomyces capricornis]|uniref:Glycosyl transferase family 2 n=2 Tax=Actinomyces TaxID=1654 RepID=A0ABM7UEK7_9ACTO|nr:glycosyltransferase [Actinomyces capricornis]BDA65611.1 hypothetical protein MANAM107_24450 [Actinomyces capricornis]
MSWSFGMFVVLICGVILMAAIGVKLLFKRDLPLGAHRGPQEQDGRGAAPSVRQPGERDWRDRGPRPSQTIRYRLDSPGRAQGFANRTGLPRALMDSSPYLPLLVLVGAYLVVWFFWRVIVTRHGSFDPWLIWAFNIVFLFVAIQLLLAFSEQRLIGAGPTPQRAAVLVPLYNEDPAVVQRMLTALLVQSLVPSEIHVVDDGSTQGTYFEQRQWFLREARAHGVYATWQRTPNQGKRHAQAQAFQQIRDAEIFVTVDSDSMLDAEAMREITLPFADPRVMSVAGVILATNNRMNLLARVTDIIFVTQQLTDRSSMSRLGMVLVNSGGLAAYRISVLADHIDLYMSEEYLGRHVEFSDDSLLTLFAALRGRTVQQPTAFAFAWMPERFSHHLRQQMRWFRGSFIRGLWRLRFLPVISWGWWRQLLGWLQLWVVGATFIYLVIWRPLMTDHGIPVEVILIPAIIGLVQNMRYVGVWRSDTSERQRYSALVLSPLATMWTTVLLRPLRVWGMLTSTRMGWNTRQQVEVSEDGGMVDQVLAHAGALSDPGEVAAPPPMGRAAAAATPPPVAEAPVGAGPAVAVASPAGVVGPPPPPPPPAPAPPPPPPPPLAGHMVRVPRHSPLPPLPPKEPLSEASNSASSPPSAPASAAKSPAAAHKSSQGRRPYPPGHLSVGSWS